MSSAKPNHLRVIAGGSLDQLTVCDGFESVPDVPRVVCVDCGAGPARLLSFTADPLCEQCSEVRDRLSLILVAVVQCKTPEQIDHYLRTGFPARIHELLADPLLALEYRDITDLLLSELRRGQAQHAA